MTEAIWMDYLLGLRIDSESASKFNIQLEEHQNSLDGAYHSDVLVYSNTALPIQLYRLAVQGKLTPK